MESVCWFAEKILIISFAFLASFGSDTVTAVSGKEITCVFLSFMNSTGNEKELSANNI